MRLRGELMEMHVHSNYDEVISEIEGHCGACKFFLAIKALRELQKDEGIVARAAMMEPAPASRPRRSCKGWRLRKRKPAAADFPHI